MPARRQDFSNSSGIMLMDNGDGTATLSGTPESDTAGVYLLTFTASNGILPDAMQNFTLTVDTLTIEGGVYLPMVVR